MKKLGFILAACLSITFGCNSVSPTESDRQKIIEHIQNWIDISEKGETDSYFDFITEDFVFYGPGATPIDNLDSLKVFLEPFFRNYSFSMPEWETREIIIKENIAIHIWSGIAHIESKDGSYKIESDRKYLDLYRKDINGEWKCYLHSFNSNN
ncbi:YybH family protein [Carboxylicivirga marina]|uniref:YybH family protein n=1 Tax=Carboxylicivirga marina TaxID=2800988 RepID=UPI0025970791|nr:DUF4440 domain-containing protein [uncultured Carboxylicivirga sp.]